MLFLVSDRKPPIAASWAMRYKVSLRVLIFNPEHSLRYSSCTVTIMLAIELILMVCATGGYEHLIIILYYYLTCDHIKRDARDRISQSS